MAGFKKQWNSGEKTSITLSVLLAGVTVLGAQKVWQAENSAEWDGKPMKTAQGIFQNPANRRLISVKAINIEPGKKYTISGDFRLTGSHSPQPFFFGFMPMTAEGKRIEAYNFRKVPAAELAEIAVPVTGGATEIILKKVSSWSEFNQKNRFVAALNAATDNSDLPNFNIVFINKVKHSGDKTVLTLNSPTKTSFTAGSKVRLHCYGPSFLYADHNGTRLNEQWKRISGTLQFDKGIVRWSPGTRQAKIVILPAGRDGILEFRNITITADDADEVINRDGEVNIGTKNHGVVISVSDSAEKASFRPASMYDGNAATAWLTGAVQNDHDIEFHWFQKNVSLAGVWLDFTPIDYKYSKDYSYLSLLNGVTPESYSGKSTLPKSIKIEIKQYGKWKTVGNYPVTSDLFFYRFSKVLPDIQRLRLSFSTLPGMRTAIREIQLPGIPGTEQDALSAIPNLSSSGAYFIWSPEGSNLIPHTKAITGYFRTPFICNNKKPVEAILTAAAYNQAEFYLNGKKLIRTPLTVSEFKPAAIRIQVPVKFLADKNIFACIADKTDMASGLYGVIYQLAIRYADGSLQMVNSCGTTTRSSLVPVTGWNSMVDGFTDWKMAHNRFISRGYPGDFWSVDVSEPFFSDEIELLSCTLTPAIPKSGERYKLEMEFNIPQPLKNNYRVTARFGELPLELYSNYGLGTAVSAFQDSLFTGDQGTKRCVITGSWIEEVTPSLLVRLAVANGKQQAFIKSKIGKMLAAPVNGQLSLNLGVPAPKLTRGFPKAELCNGRFCIDGKLAAPLFFEENKMTAGRLADQFDHKALQMIRTGRWSFIVDPDNRKAVHENYIKTFEMCADYALRKNPDSKFMLVFGLDPIAEWLFANQDEQIELGDGSRLMGFYNNRGSGNLQVRASLASEPYRKMIYDNIYELISRLKNHPYANSIVAVSFGVGLAYENNWGVDRYDFARGERNRQSFITGDFGVAARKALIKFLARRYQSDIQWAESWKLSPRMKMNDLLSFSLWPHDEIQSIMLWRDRPADRFIFRDGQKDGRAAEDMNEFCSITRAEVLNLAAKAVKEASDFRLLTGSYAGYVFPQLINNPTGSSVYSGHAAAKMLRESKYFDFFSSPQWCHTLDLPLFYSVLNDSLGLYGKTYIIEGDIRTHSAAFGSLYSRKEMISQLRKIAGFMLTKNFGAWFLGWSYSFAGPQGIRFFSDNVLLNELKSLRQASELPPVKEPASGNRIALLVSEHSSWFMDLMSPANTVHAMMLYKNLHKFLRTGAGCDIMALEDLPQLVKTGRLKDYKLVAFFNAFHLNDKLRNLINKEVKSDNRMLLFFYAPGFHDDAFNAGKGTSVSTAGIANLLGIKKVFMLKEDHLIGAAWNNGQNVDCNIWWDVHQKAVFKDEIGPVFWLPTDAKIEKLASLRMDGRTHDDKIAAAKIKGKDHTVIYVAVPDIPLEMLKELVKESGTVIAADEEAFVNCGNGFMVVTNSGNQRKITLRAAYKADWIELPDNKKTASATNEIKVEFEHHETRLFRLIPVK